MSSLIRRFRGWRRRRNRNEEELTRAEGETTIDDITLRGRGVLGSEEGRLYGKAGGEIENDTWRVEGEVDTRCIAKILGGLKRYFGIGIKYDRNRENRWSILIKPYGHMRQVKTYYPFIIGGAFALYSYIDQTISGHSDPYVNSLIIGSVTGVSSKIVGKYVLPKLRIEVE